MRRREHHVRGIALSCAVILLSYSVSLFTPEVIAGSVTKMLANAAVGVSIGVEPNPYNTLASQLSDKEKELEAREDRILALEASVSDARSLETYLAAGSLVLSIFLFALVALNFYRDARRASAGSPRPFAVDLCAR
jgi:hypothetical protein